MSRYHSTVLVAVAVLILGGGITLYRQLQPATPPPPLHPNPSLSVAGPHSVGSPHDSTPDPDSRGGVPATPPADPAAVLIHTQQCSVLPAMVEARHRVNDCGPNVPSDPKALAGYSECLNKAAGEQEISRKLEDQLKTCSADELTPAGLFAATKAAAEQGSAYARVCFIQGRFVADWRRRDQPPLPQSDVDAYLVLAPKLIEEGLERGDWGTVAMLTRDRSSFAPGDLLPKLNYGIGTTETVYKMTRLLQLGSNEDFAAQLQKTLDHMTHPEGGAFPALSADALATADQWAQDMYAAHFTSSPRLDAMPVGCVPPRDNRM